MTVIWLKLSCVLYFCVTNVLTRGIVFHYNNTYKYDVPYEVTVNKYTEYIMEFAGDLEVYNTPARVTVASDFANSSYPVFITARQQRGVFAWQLPMVVQTTVSVKFTNISRTLCPHNNPYGEDEEACDVPNSNTPIVHLTSASPDDVSVTLLVETVQDFFIKLNSTTNLKVTPSQPKYYFFPFDQRPNLGLDLQGQSLKHKSRCNEKLGVDEQSRLDRYLRQSTSVTDDSWLSRPKSVIVLIESEDDVCAVVSIQSFSCPVFDNERDILYDGYYLTMTRRGGITLTQDAFPVGFYIVFIVKSDDDDCVSTPGNATARALYDDRVKSFSFRIISTISYRDYLIAAGAALAFFLSFYVGFIAVILCQRRKLNTVVEVNAEVHSEEGFKNEDHVNINSSVRRDDNVQSTSAVTLLDDGDGARDSSSSDTESIASVVEDPNADTDLLYVAGARLCVANLARCRPRVLQARSKMYLWNVLTVAVFYTLPVIQLVVTYQRLLNQSGNQDLCYFNFLCAHPLVVLSDFNHVYSNLGYVLLGALFLLAVWRRHVRYKACSPAKKEMGIPQHFGLLYAMGVALVSEGVLSAAYHVCPNSMNFQFDTSFMYVTSVLCMVKIYQSRHPDINARAHATFGVLALIIFIGLVGVLNANFYFWVIFTVVHIVMCLFMTFQIYYLGRFRLEWRVLSSAWSLLWSRPVAAVTPARAGRCVLLLIANLANWALAALGIAQHSKDFASHLLLILMSNLFLYTLFYIVMKLLHRESIKWYSWVYIALTYTIWFSSSYFYLDQSTNWALTPAQSRQSNRVCSLLQLYDSHDIWHFMSSVAMFISFNMYLTIDDNLSNVPRDEIMVF